GPGTQPDRTRSAEARRWSVPPRPKTLARQPSPSAPRPRPCSCRRDHVGAQACINRDLVRAIAGAGGRVIPIKVGHGIDPCFVPALRPGLSPAEAGIIVARI